MTIAKENIIIVMGDSLSSAYGIPLEQGWVSLLQQKLKESDYTYKVINASISGETSYGGLTRFTEVITQYQPEIIILELGANDALRGLSFAQMEINLGKIIKISEENNAKVLLLGLYLPLNYGPYYNQLFHKSFENLVEKYQVAFVPFFLQKVGSNPHLMQEDGLHPRAEAQPIILENIYPSLEALLK